jgi:hypothetical protein
MRVGGVGSRNILGKKDHRCGKFGLKSPASSSGFWPGPT